MAATRTTLLSLGVLALSGMEIVNAQETSPGTAPASDIQPVGQEPQQREEQPEVQAISDIGGVLTPRGQLVLEPSLQYSHSSTNRLTFRGVEILSTLLIGVFEAEDADRDTWTAAMTGRWGVTDRLELELKLPYVYRDDSLFATVATPEDTQQGSDITRDLSGDGVGDIELAAHYQINSGQNGGPFFIGNLRYKSATGEGPFDIRRDSDGIEQELATGSGFHSIEPSITMLYPSDPAVYFANLGYLYNIKDDINKQITEDIRIGEVEPGNAIRVSFGMAYAINARSSFTLGFKNDFIDNTKTEFIDSENGSTSAQSSRSLNIASLLLGWSYQVSPRTSVSLNLELGVTEDAPDTLLTFRVPVGMNMY